MKTIQTIAQRIRQNVKTNTNTPVQCNFADNYYGDRVCVMPAQTAVTK